MILQTVQLTNFRSVEDSGVVELDPNVTAFVGLNESGKTCLLHATHKALGRDEDFGFDVITDYPRRRLSDYQRRHETDPDKVIEFIFELTAAEMKDLATKFGHPVLISDKLTVSYRYNGRSTWTFSYNEAAYVAHLIKTSGLDAGVVSAVSGIKTLRELLDKLATLTLDEKGKLFLQSLTQKFPAKKLEFTSLLARALIDHFSLPKTFYFDDYYLLPGKVNLVDLQNRKSRDQLEESHRTILALLEVAGVTIEDLLSPTNYEGAKARLEAISARITDRIFEYWQQNDQLEVEFDIDADPNDASPYNNGKNLYVRIKNQRHRVTMPLSNRSKGFVWFFSFLIWFERLRMNAEDAPAILLLDEPGLNLHALGQHDLLRYIDHLAESHQVLYSTHSPFMIQSDQLSRVRVVEDKPKIGTKVTSNISTSNRNTLFPLQAALGYTIAQNLFISKRNLLVEGPADLLLLQFFSSRLEQIKRTGLRDDLIVVPAGGGGKIATFVALLNANNLELVTLTDYAGKPDESLKSLARDKIIPEKLLLHYGMFRGANGTTAPATDVEDLLPVTVYLDYFNRSFGTTFVESDLPAGDRILDRLNRLLEARKLKLRPSGGFNHFTVMEKLATAGDYAPDTATLDRFEQLFTKTNGLFSTA
jgi:predicted ATP-dependent endonuclease of OLD family